jgi:cobalt/nickel transport system permease protein
MHVPDGYLSPSTCATLYVLAGSGWYSALRRIKRALNTRVIPLISVFAAFSFVMMMFNLPLPGGTTGHAVGVGIAAVVLGPSGAILAISIALAIQALFFADGGITTLGANCFNMAIVGSLVAYWVYRLLAGASAPTARRRVVAAAIGGYLAINASALCTALQLGIQPMLFHDATGAPLYAPYPLRIAVPAMMLGHLTVAGFAEALVTAGMVSFLQVSNIGLLKGAAATSPTNITAPAVELFSLRKLWLTVAALLLLTPLGILAAGTAWGEWSAGDFSDPHQRAAIAASSNNAPLPPSAPKGLEKLSSTWTAPFPDYAPAFIKSERFGYMLSGMFGVGLLLGVGLFGSAVSRRIARSASVAQERAQDSGA